MSKSTNSQLRRSYTTGSILEMLQHKRQNLSAPFQLYSSGVLFPTNSTKCQYFYQEPNVEGDSCRIGECNTKPEFSSGNSSIREYCETLTSGGEGKHNENDRKEHVRCLVIPNSNCVMQTERKRLSQHEPLWSQNHFAMTENTLPARSRTCSMSDKYLKAYSLRQPLCDVVRSTRFRGGTDGNFSPSKHLSHIQDLSSFARERISSVSSTATVQCVDSYDVPGATDYIFNVSPDWSVSAVQAFRLVIIAKDKTARKLFLDDLLLCGETADNDDVFDEEEKTEQTISVKYNGERYNLTLCEIEEEEVEKLRPTDVDALVTLVQREETSWFIRFLRGLKTTIFLIAAATNSEVNPNCLPDDLSGRGLLFQCVDLHEQSTVETFVSTVIQHLTSLHPTPEQSGALDSTDRVDKQAVFRRFFWRSVSTTRSCENLLAL